MASGLCHGVIQKARYYDVPRAMGQAFKCKPPQSLLQVPHCGPCHTNIDHLCENSAYFSHIPIVLGP